MLITILYFNLNALLLLLFQFELNYPDEYITSIQGTYSNVARYNTTIVKTLTFKTSHGRTSPMFGNTAIFSTDFVVEGKAGAKLMGFHGRSGSALDAIGAHFFASTSPLKHIEPRGGFGGNAWDDGVYDGVSKISVGLNCGNIGYVRFKYVKGSTSVRHSHGKMSEEPKVVSSISKLALIYSFYYLSLLMSLFCSLRWIIQTSTLHQWKGLITFVVM